MTASGTTTFAADNATLVLEAFDRIKVRPSQIDSHQLISARRSLNFELLDWSNRGFNFWKLASGTIPLVAGQAVYTLPSSLVTMTELWYSQVNGGGTGVNQDRIMVPITRTQYSQIVNKLQTGIPTQYWFQMLAVPQVTIWEVPQGGQISPNYVLGWYGLSQIQDANLGSGETPDVHYRALDALADGVAVRLFRKFGDGNNATLEDLKSAAAESYTNLTRRDQEPGPLTFRANAGAYGRLW